MLSMVDQDCDLHRGAGPICILSTSSLTFNLFCPTQPKYHLRSPVTNL
jgi:hypothetical protein